MESPALRSAGERYQEHGAPWSGGMRQTPVDRAQRPVEGLGESDIARVVGGDVCAQLEGSAHQPKRGESGQRDVRKVLYSLLEPLVGDGASEPPPPKHCSRLDIDEIRRGEFAVLAEQLTGLPTGLLVVADGVGQHGGVDDDHLVERSSARSAAA